MEIKQTSDIVLDRLKIIIYGESGSGKTRFSSTAPKPIFFDFDGGLLSLKGLKDVAYINYTDLEIQAVWPQFLLDLKEISNDDRYETIIIDSLTTASNSCMDYVLSVSRRLGKNPQLQDWLTQMNLLKDMIKSLIVAPKHAILTAHEQVDKDELLGKVWVLPLVTGKMARQIGLYFDEFYHAEAERKGTKIEYKLLTKSTGLYTAKSRIGFSDLYIQPDFNKILNNK